MAKLTPEQILEMAIARGDPIPYSRLYKPKGNGLELLPEYMVYNLTHPRKRSPINYTKFYKNPSRK